MYSLCFLALHITYSNCIFSKFFTYKQLPMVVPTWVLIHIDTVQQRFLLFNLTNGKSVLRINCPSVAQENPTLSATYFKSLHHRVLSHLITYYERQLLQHGEDAMCRGRYKLLLLVIDPGLHHRATWSRNCGHHATHQSTFDGTHPLVGFQAACVSWKLL